MKKLFLLITLCVFIGRAYTQSVECVLSKGNYASFNEAKNQSISEVNDGDPVIMYLKFPKPVSAYAGQWYFGNQDIMYTNMPGLCIEVGPAGKKYEEFNKSVFLLKPSELDKTELKINLAPGEVRPIPVNVWMKTVGEGSPGVWKNEVRVYRPVANPDDKVFLTIVPLTANVGSSIAKYKTMLKDYNTLNEIGDPSFNTVPDAGKLTDPEATKIVKAKIAAVRPGVTLKRFFFTSDNWGAYRNDFDQIEKHMAYASITYQKGGKNWNEMVEITRWLNGKYDVSLYSLREISADKL